ncbi:MAG: hypothetical protein ACRBCT_08810 [Alphaproteobacteria bacterium]
MTLKADTIINTYQDLSGEHDEQKINSDNRELHEAQKVQIRALLAHVVELNAGSDRYKLTVSCEGCEVEGAHLTLSAADTEADIKITAELQFLYDHNEKFDRGEAAYTRVLKLNGEDFLYPQLGVDNSDFDLTLVHDKPVYEGVDYSAGIFFEELYRALVDEVHLRLSQEAVKEFVAGELRQ